MSKAKRIICLILSAFMIASLCACGGTKEDKKEATPDETKITPRQTEDVQKEKVNAEDKIKTETLKENLNTDVSAAIMQSRAISLPLGGVKIWQAVKAGEQLLMFGRDSEGENKFFLYDLASDNAEGLELEIHGEFYSLCQSSDGKIMLLTVDENGDYILSGYENTVFQSAVKLNIPKKYVGNNIDEIAAVNGKMILCIGGTVFLMDESGEIVKELGDYTYNPVCILNDDGSILICRGFYNSMDDNDHTTFFSLYDGNFNLINETKIQKIYDCISASDTSENVLVFLKNALYKLNYKNGGMLPLIDCASSCMHSNNILLLNDGKLFSIENGMGAVWEECTEQSETITLATYELNRSLQQIIEDYNSRNLGYKIVVRDYAEYDLSEGSDVGMTQLNADYISDNSIDILDLTNMPAKKFAKSGALKDISGWVMEENKQILPSIYESLKDGDNLYYMTPSFSILSMVSSQEISGGLSKWSLQDFMEKVSVLPFSNTIGTNISRERFLAYIILFNFSEYIDTNNLNSNFYDGNFSKILEYASQLPEEGVPGGPNDFGAIACGDQKVYIGWIGANAVKTVSFIDGAFNNEPNYIGFPASNSSGYALAPSSLLGVSAKTSNIQGCKSFFDFVLGEECQGNSYINDLPVRKDVLTAKLDKQGENYIKLPPSLGAYANGVKLSIAGTEELNVITEQLYEIIDSLNVCTVIDDDMLNLILKDSQDYFNGKMSSELTAKEIDSRLKIYLAEQYG